MTLGELRDALNKLSEKESTVEACVFQKDGSTYAWVHDVEPDKESKHILVGRFEPTKSQTHAKKPRFVCTFCGKRQVR